MPISAVRAVEETLRSLRMHSIFGITACAILSTISFEQAAFYMSEMGLKEVMKQEIETIGLGFKNFAGRQQGENEAIDAQRENRVW